MKRKEAGNWIPFSSGVMIIGGREPDLFFLDFSFFSCVSKREREAAEVELVFFFNLVLMRICYPIY